MLKKVALTELEIGMFVHKMEGSWFDHPFWRANFLLDDDGKLRTIRASRLKGVIIDTSKGRDTGQGTQEAERPSGNDNAPSVATPPAAGRAEALRKRASIERPPPVPVSLGQEIAAAQGIADAAQKSLSKAFLATRLGKALNVRAVEPVVRDVYESVRRNPHAFSGLMRCKLNNEFVYRHALSVSALMVSLAGKMKLSQTDIYRAGMTGLLLDIGTNYLPRELAPPSGDYREAGPKIWQQHVILGVRALESEGDVPKTVLEACLQHHERIDGTGFPCGLEEDEIGQMGRMAAICDSFDFLLAGNAESAALDPAEAVRRLTEIKGAFDPEILRHFIESVGLYPIGSFVRLRSEKIAMVIDEDRKDSARPVVQAFYSLAKGEKFMPQRVELAQCVGKDEIVDIADLAGLGLGDIGHLREMLFLGAHSG